MLVVSGAFPAIFAISENKTKKRNNTYTKRVTPAHVQDKIGQISQLYQHHFADRY